MLKLTAGIVKGTSLNKSSKRRQVKAPKGKYFGKF